MSQIQQLPLVYGDGKKSSTMDWVTQFPVNMIPVARPIKGANGYMRMFPGLVKQSDVDGVSRGSHWNTVKESPYRVMGGKLYLNGDSVSDVPSSGRVSMAHSRTSQGVSVDGQLRLYQYDGSVKVFSNWPTTGAPTDVTFDWGEVGDVTHLRQRYVFAQKGTDTFWVSSLEDESHPDKVAPFYRAESMPDGILAMREWRDYVLCFGSSTIEFFGLTGNAQQILQAQPSYMVRIGIAGQFALCDYLDTFAFVSSPSRGQPSVYMMASSGGSYQEIANYQINQILSEYSTAELAETVCERIYIKSHKFLIIHLKRHTLIYDALASQSLGIQAWSILKTGLNDDVYRAIDFMNEGDVISCGDKIDGILGKQTDSLSSQYGVDQELILYTPMIRVENAIISDFEIDANTGADTVVSHVFVSTTEDGINYGMEKLVNYDAPWKWLSRTLWRRVGRIRTQIGFKIRMVGATPATMANCQVRLD